MKQKILTKIKDNIFLILAAVPLYYIYRYIGCPFRYLFGFSCAGCGMTRALWAIGDGDFALAFEMSPAIYLLPVAAVIYFLRKRIPKKVMNMLCSVGLVIVMTMYFVRLFSDNEVVYIDFKTGLIYKIIQSLLN